MLPHDDVMHTLSFDLLMRYNDSQEILECHKAGLQQEKKLKIRFQTSSRFDTQQNASADLKPPAARRPQTLFLTQRFSES